jgi:hypothetical protein
MGVSLMLMTLVAHKNTFTHAPHIFRKFLKRCPLKIAQATVDCLVRASHYWRWRVGRVLHLINTINACTTNGSKHAGKFNISPGEKA